jgi:PAS domain S-box-containing protein
MKQPDSSQTNHSTISNENHTKQLYKNLLYPMFNTMLTGIACCKMVCKDDGSQDFEFVFVNSAFESLTGLNNVNKRLISELIPGIHNSDPELLDLFGRVAFNETAEKGEIYIHALQLWLSISVHSPEREYFIALVDVINERKIIEEDLHCKTALLEAQLNSSIEGIMIVDGLGKKILQNQRTVELWKIPKYIADNPDDQTQVQHVQQMTTDPELFVKKVHYLYNHPDEAIRDEVELIDGTVLDRYSAPVVGKEGHCYGRIWTFRDITERKRNEEALSQKTALLEALLNSTIEGFMVMDVQGKKIIDNQRNNDLWKIPPHLSGNCNLETRRQYIQSMAKNPETFSENISYLINNSDKTSRDEVELIDGTVLDRYSAPVLDVNGHYYGRIWTFRDITERKQVEEVLRQKTALLEAQLNSSIEGVLIVDSQGKKVLQNQRTIDLWKIPQHIVDNPDDEMQVQHVQYMTKNPEAFVKKVIYLYHNPDMTSRDEVELIDGTILDRYSAPVLGKDGHNYGRIWAFRDITERKLAEANIAAEKELLSVTLRSIGDGVITTDIRGNIVIMNKVAEDLTGWQLHEAQGKPLASVFIIINEITRSLCENPVEKVLSTGLIVELANHTLLISRSGVERVISDSGAPIKNSNGETIGVVLVFRDTTEKQKMLDNMQRIDKLDSLGVLAGGIAHDFNNLLSGIFGFMEMARKVSTDNKTVTKYLDRALTVFNRARDLTQQLLTFSKGGAPKRKTGNLDMLIKESVVFVLSGSNVSCEFDIVQDLWLCDFDENQIGQVLDNIIINAQEAMPLGGKIFITAENLTLKELDFPLLRGGDYVKVSITDTGVGIPQEILNRIFDPFFTTKQMGNGLGLATCYSIIQKHDGCIDVESMPGNGTTFHLYLPATQNEFHSSSLSPSLQHTGNGRILVMDDEDCVREVAAEMLMEMGYTIIGARDGAEALRLCAEAKEKGEHIHCAFFDLTIPGGMSGREAIVKLRRFAPDMPVFVSSGFSDDPVIARPTEFGFTDSIRKPFRFDDLADMLNKHFKPDEKKGI